MKKILLFCTFVAVPYICCSQGIDTVMARIERNNLELQALRESNKASMLEIKAENNIQQDLSVSYSPFFSNGVRGVASSEFVASLGFDFPTQYAARKKWGDYRSEEIGRQYLLQRRDILLEAKKLCLEIIRLDAEKEILDTRLENADELLALVFFQVLLIRYQKFCRGIQRPKLVRHLLHEVVRNYDHWLFRQTVLPQFHRGRCHRKTLAAPDDVVQKRTVPRSRDARYRVLLMRAKLDCRVHAGEFQETPAALLITYIPWFSVVPFSKKLLAFSIPYCSSANLKHSSQSIFSSTSGTFAND